MSAPLIGSKVFHDHALIGSDGKCEWAFQLAVALILVAALAVVSPNVESGMNDDWSFMSAPLSGSKVFHGTVL